MINSFKKKYFIGCLLLTSLMLISFHFFKPQTWTISGLIPHDEFLLLRKSTDNIYLNSTTIEEYVSLRKSSDINISINYSTMMADNFTSGEPVQPVSPSIMVWQRCKTSKKSYSPITLNESFDSSVIRRHPNLPEFLIKSPSLIQLIPHLTKIRWSGTLYQESWNEHPKCYLYSANFDSRLTTGPIVRLLGLCEEKNMNLNYYCQFWYKVTESPIVSPVYEAYFPGANTGSNGKLRTTMMACKIPPEEEIKAIPIAVSIVKKSCTKPTNILQIGGSPYKKNDLKPNDKNKTIKIGLCGKALYYYNKDFSIRLIEWIEIMKIVGISKFFLYKTPCHKNVENVLDYYEKEGTVKILSFHYPSPFVQEATFLRLWTKTNLGDFRAGQRIFYNDCTLRNKDDYDYLAIFDYDEIPILKKHKNLIEMMKDLRKSYEKQNFASFGLRWKTFYSSLESGPKAANISSNFHILRHNRRTLLGKSMKDEGNVKSIYDSNKILFVACHSRIKHKPIFPLSDKEKVLPRKLAYTAHFPDRDCGSNCKKNGTEEEIVLLQHKKEIIDRVEKVLKETDIKHLP